MYISVWEKESFLAPKEVIIAGSGFVGLWSAYYLKKSHPGLSVTLVEKSIFPSGASTRNAGFSCFGSVTELISDVVTMGEAQMLQLVEMRYRGMQRIRKVFSRKEIDFSMPGGYELIPSTTPSRELELRQQVSWINNSLSSVLNKRKTFEFADDKIKKFGISGASHLIENKLEGHLHPGRLCQALTRMVQSMGVTILNNTAITGYEKTGDHILIYTNRDFQLRAGKLLICTNAFAKELVPELELIPARGQILVTTPIRGLRIRGAFHYDEGYYYFRDLGDRLLVGGARNKAFEEETTTDTDITAGIQGELESFIARHLLPGIPYQVAERWSGIMDMRPGPEKTPIVKTVSDQVYCAVGMGGMGVALAPVVGKQVAKLMYH